VIEARRGDRQSQPIRRPVQIYVGRHIRQHCRLEERATLRGALSAAKGLGTLLHGVGGVLSTFSTALMSISGPITALGSNPSTASSGPPT
jgi:hypothetical protein